MIRAVWVAVVASLVTSCCTDAEKAPLPPLPKEGVSITYAEVLIRLTSQTTTARDEHFLNHWEMLAEVAQGMEQSASLLPRSTDVPLKRQANLQQDFSALVMNIRQLQTTAKMKDQAQSLESIRRIHNQIRELKDDTK